MSAHAENASSRLLLLSVAVGLAKRLLLVEDNEINREIAFAYLEGTELDVDVAENGAEALEKYLAGPGAYDLVLMDVHMPVMDGHLAKPMNTDDVMRTLLQYLAGKRQ